jgi:two-component system sensor histidine kinase RegB
MASDISYNALVDARHGSPSRPRETASGNLLKSGDATGRKNLALLIQFRWIAVLGQVATMAVVSLWLGVALPLPAMIALLVALIALNLASVLWLRSGAEVNERGLLLSLVLDVLVLTGQLYLSGGATNPFVFLYILQVTLAAVLLDTRAAAAVGVLTAAAFAGLTVFNQPLLLPPESPYAFLTLHIAGIFVCFVLDATLLVVFVTRITRNLRDRDARLAALRQRAAEEDHIVRMGLLASGAAHELGTPLASLSVILGDWRHMPALASEEMQQEIGEMQAAVDRCKAILTGILLSAGEARGEAPAVTGLSAFLDELVAEWRQGRPGGEALRYSNIIDDDISIVSDTALKQVISNVLDNAAEASPRWVNFTAERTAEALVLRVEDAGPGFTAEMLAQVGKPYSSSKGRPGGGLGLFLVVNVVRKLGGNVSVRNRETRGAEVVITLPLERLAIGETADV